MTDGISADSVRGPAQRLKAGGAEVFAIGLGRRFSYRQLVYIATDSRHIFKQDFTALAKALKPMTRTVCRGKKLQKLVSRLAVGFFHANKQKANVIGW